MERQHRIAFGPFCLDVTHGRLWRGEHVLALRPRSLAVLRYLAEHPGRLVTKAELQQQVWAGTHVSTSVLRVSITEIRAALGDAATAPRYLETVGQQGYRFLAWGDMDRPPPLAPGPIVGRHRDVALLEQWLQDAVGGSRRLGFVSGDVGIGKTTVVDLVLARLAAGSGVRSARGQCVEQYGAGEPYLALLEAVGRLCRGPAGQEALAVLRHYAPMWLVQFPELVGERDLERLQRQVHGATPARMLRELGQALEALTTDTPLVLVLEDLHWSDPSTVECLAYLAQRREPARLLVLGTYRPAEAVIHAHPLRRTVQELCGRGQAVELCLEPLLAEDVSAYVAGRCAGPVAAPLAAFVHARTDGRPLFMTTIVEHLVHQGLVVRREGQWTLRDGSEAITARLPEGLRQLLVRRLEELSPEAQRVLEAASVMGEAFAAVAVAAGAQLSVAAVEEVCDGLVAQQHVLDDTGLTVWPDGSSGGSYRFRHALYQQVLYERLGRTWRARVHRRLGARLEVGYGVRVGEVATQLAVHFERGGEVQRAVPYRRQAAERALRRHAYQEAIEHCTKGLEGLTGLPETETRTALALHLTLGAALLVTRGFAAPEVEQTHRRAYELCQPAGESLELGVVLHSLASFYNTRSEFQIALDIEARLLRIAQHHHHPVLLAAAHRLLGSTLLYRGDFVGARHHLEQSLGPTAPIQDDVLTALSSWEGQTIGCSMLAAVLARLGYPEQARQRSHEAMTLTQEQPGSFLRATALLFMTIVQQFCRDAQGTRASASALMALAAEQGFALFRALGMALHGWAGVMQGQGATDIAQIRQALAVHAATGAQLPQPYMLAMLAEAYGAVGQVAEAMTTLTEALTLVDTTGEAHIAAHLYWLKGKLLLAQHGAPPESRAGEVCLQQALDVARGQQAKALELQAAVSLSRLWQRQGKREEARQLLAPIYGWFTEGFETADLQEAKTVLGALG